MGQDSVKQQKLIFEQLKKDDVRTVVLFGEPGVGKTWMAKKLSKCAIKHRLFEIVLWVFLNTKYTDQSLCENFGRQLSLLSTDEEWEDEDENDTLEAKTNEAKTNGESVYSWKNLQEQISQALKGKRVLLILDDEGSKTSEENIRPQLNVLLQPELLSSCKVLITTVTIRSSCPDGTRKEMKVEPLSSQEALALLQKNAGFQGNECPAVKRLANDFIEKSKKLPAEIIVVAKALKYFGKNDYGAQKLERILAEASDITNCNLLQLMCSHCATLPHSILTDSCKRGGHFFRERGSIHYSELIAYWILEGYLGHGNCIKKAYEEGHRVLMELIDFRILKQLDAGYVVMEETLMNAQDYEHCGFGGTARLGFAELYEDGEWEGLGAVAPADGILKTLCNGKAGQKLSTMLVDGNLPWREVSNHFPMSGQALQVLALFRPTLKSFPLSFSEMHNFCVLVLRGCDFMGNISLGNIDEALKLEKLTVLEISGPSSLETLPDNIFKHMPFIRSLNLSGLHINTLPSSVYELGGLRWLILRGCSCIKTLSSLRNFKKLLVLDLSGATSLTTIQDKTFSNTELQLLNLSQTRVKNLPLLSNLGKLTHLLLCDCKNLDRLRSVKLSICLQVLDLSGAHVFKEFNDQSFEHLSSLRTLNLSETKIDHLPSSISNPRNLYLKGCLGLKKLPFMALLKDLEVLDLSGACNLVEIDENFFKNMRFLQVLNLSKTKIVSLPSLSTLHNLRQLLLSGCLFLKDLQGLDSLRKLEVLDMSDCTSFRRSQEDTSVQVQRPDPTEIMECFPSFPGLSNLRCLLLKNCPNPNFIGVLPPHSLSGLEELNLDGVSSLKVTGAEFLKHLNGLRILDLSGTLLEQLPSLSNLQNLTELSIRACPGLLCLPGLESLTKLETLDLSGTGVRDLPCLDNFGNLKQLLLRDCLSLEGFWDLEVIDLLGSTVNQLPYGISKLTHLDRLELPNMKSSQDADSVKIIPNVWNISIFPDKKILKDRLPLSISSAQFVQHLNKNTSVWDTNFTRFHFFVYPSERQHISGAKDFRNEFMFRDIYFRTTQFAEFKDQRSLVINGFDQLPKDIEDILNHTDCLFLIDNAFKRWLSDLGASNLKVLRGCWIERCMELESVFHSEEAEDIAKLAKTFEILGITNVASLKSIHGGNLPSEGFQNLKCLYLDCCPQLSIVFPSTLLPENLKVLQIKFCGQLESLFEHVSSEHTLPNLETLHLGELPKLKNIGCKFPSLQTLKVCGCPKLQKLEETIKLAKCLQFLWISNVAELRSVYKENQQPQSFNNLKSLMLENCNKLVSVISSSQPPQNLEIIQIKYCDKLVNVFTNNTSGDFELPNLRTLHLQELPKLESIGCRLPNLLNPVVIKCPKCKDSNGGVNFENGSRHAGTVG